MKETVHHDTKPSLRHLDSIDSAALKPPEVSFPHRPSSPAHTGPLGEFAGDKSTFPKKEGEEVKPLEASSSARGSGGSGGSASFNWASIKVGELVLSPCDDANCASFCRDFLSH